MTLQVRLGLNLSRMPAGQPTDLLHGGEPWDMAAGRGGAGPALPLDFFCCALCGFA